MKRLSIKLRVTLWFTLLMLVIVAAVLTFLLSASKRLATSGSLATLRHVVEESLNEIEFDDGRLEIDDDLDYFSDGVYITVYDADGRLLYGRRPSGYTAETAFLDGEARTVACEGGNWYVQDVLYSVWGYGNVWVRGLMSAADNTINKMPYLAMIAFPFLVLLAAVCGYGMINRAFLPVRQITATAERIGSGMDLTARIGLPEGRDEISTLACTFDRMFDRLQASFESEKQFTSDASHELRTPTAVILSQCEYSLENATSLDEAKAALSSVQTQAQRMSALIGSLLTLARADSRHEKLHLERINLSDLVEMVASEVAEQAAARNISLEADVEPDILLSGDETMLMRMLLNLMGNGVKYGRDGGRLRVRLQRDGKSIVGTVADDGIGMLPMQMAHIFERFYRADAARSTAQPGAGLGLPMVEYIVKAHGGSISVESEYGKGSKFTFILPAA